jgi:phosphohistidine phosphatase
MTASGGERAVTGNVRVYIAHHGDALAPGENALRPLSPAGQQQVESLAREAAMRGVKPRAIWHSGKLRARQTAEAYWRACNPLADFQAVRGLQPDDPPSWIADRLLIEEGEVMVVGHMPHLPRLLRLLLSANPDADAPDFPAHGLVCVEKQGERWAEQWRLTAPTVSR